MFVEGCICYYYYLLLYCRFAVAGAVVERGRQEVDQAWGTGRHVAEGRRHAAHSDVRRQVGTLSDVRAR